jgi:phosphoglycolate phosphatase/pyrophosphatase PpaX
MLRYPCLVLDHDDTVVQSEISINYPFFCYILDRFRPGTTITLEEYVEGCSSLGFLQMCRQWYQFTDAELKEEYEGWMDYVRSHIPDPFPGIGDVIRRQKEEGGLVCVVSHSSAENITRDYQTHFGMLPDAIYGWDLPEHQRKPNTYSLEAIMERYHLSSKDLLVIDDMKPAWEMASKAGVEIGFAAWGKVGFPAIAEEMKRLCDYTFQSPRELAQFLFDSP